MPTKLLPTYIVMQAEVMFARDLAKCGELTKVLEGTVTWLGNI